MNKSNSSLARQVAEASSTFELQRTGRAPAAVTVLMAETRWSSASAERCRRPRRRRLEFRPVPHKCRNSTDSCSPTPATG